MLLRCGGLLPSRERVNTLKAYSVDDDEKLRWELRRLLPAAGYEMSAKNGQVDDILRTQKRVFLALLDLLCLPGAQHFGESQHSLRVRHELCVSKAADQEWWVSTEAMLALIAFYGSFRRSTAQKQRCKLLLGWICEATLDLTHAWETRLVPDGFVARCTWRLDGQGHCAHVDAVLANLPARPTAGRHDEVSDLAAELSAWMEAPHATKCRAIGSHIGSIFRVLAENIEARVGTWGIQNWHKAIPPLEIAGRVGCDAV